VSFGLQKKVSEEGGYRLFRQAQKNKTWRWGGKIKGLVRENQKNQALCSAKGRKGIQADVNSSLGGWFLDRRSHSAGSNERRITWVGTKRWNQTGVWGYTECLRRRSSKREKNRYLSEKSGGARKDPKDNVPLERRWGGGM